MFFNHLGVTVLFNTVIALFLYSTDLFQAPFLPVFIISQSIGISICLSIGLAFRLFMPEHQLLKLGLLLLSIVVGTTAGLFLGSLLTYQDPSESLLFVSYIVKTLILGLFFGVIISYFFISRHRITLVEAQIREERLKRVTTQKQAAETRLRLLQAQIEPHFLFNTLSNIVSLIETDVEKGKSMLIDLTQYLRAALSKTRSDRVTLGQELELIKAYMQIYKVRMGDRLKFTVAIPDTLEEIKFPPMLIQPLVENSIKHGLEPKIEGGEITISACRTNQSVQIRIADTGLGLANMSEKGMGLTNISQRLESIYGNRGLLILEENEPQGLTAIIEVPYEQSS